MTAEQPPIPGNDARNDARSAWRRNASAPKTAGGCGGTAFLTVWTLGWVAGLTVFAVEMLPDYWRAIRSYGFDSTPGRVIECQVETHAGGEDGPTYSLDLSYAYRVDGRNFVGTRYDANSTNNSDHQWHRQTAAALRPDAAVTVYHSPDDPADSLLVPGVTGGHLFTLVFFTPFAAVALLAGGFLWTQFRRRSGPAEPPPRTIADGRLIRAPLAPCSPLVAGALWAGGVCFVGVFVVAFGFGFRPPIWAPGSVLLLAAVAAVGGGAGVASRRATGAYDLVIDPDRELLALPLTQGRTTRLVVPFAGVERVGIDEDRSDGSTYAAAVFLNAEAAAELGVKPTQPLTMYSGPAPRSRTRDGLVRWLREQLGQAEGDAAE